jgi:hypothetical protein
MHLAVFSVFAAKRSEPLAAMLERVHGGFADAGFGEPTISFILSDPVPLPNAAALGIKPVSSIARVLKRFPQLGRFERDAPAMPGGPPAVKVLSNVTPAGALEPADFPTLLEIARGVPKSFPFRKVWLHFSAPGFSDGPSLPASLDRKTLSLLMRAGVDIGAGHPTAAGITVQDSWWVNGRQRDMAALRVVAADPTARKLPPPPPAVAALLAACGKVRKTTQLPIVVGPAPGETAASEAIGAASSSVGEAIRAVVRDYRARIPELLEALPHDLPHQADRSAELSTLSPSGPRKPALEEAFRPLGYDCKGGSGTFMLRRRTPTNLTVELDLDVGTWSNSLTAFYRVQGLVDGQGFKATLNLPVSRQAARGVVHGAELAAQFPIGGPGRWRLIVENLAALVNKLDGSFVPAVEAAAGPSPEWYRPSDG